MALPWKKSEVIQQSNLNICMNRLLDNDKFLEEQIQSVTDFATSAVVLAIHATKADIKEGLTNNRYISPSGLSHWRPEYVSIDGYSPTNGIYIPLEKYSAYQSGIRQFTTTYQIEGFTSNISFDTSRITELHVIGYYQTHNYYKYPATVLVQYTLPDGSYKNLCSSSESRQSRGSTDAGNTIVMMRIPINKNQSTITLKVYVHNRSTTYNKRDTRGPWPNQDTYSNYYQDNYAGFKIIGATIL